MYIGVFVGDRELLNFTWELVYIPTSGCLAETLCYVSYHNYSRKYWWELNLVVEPKIAIAKILADFDLVVAR